MPDRYTLKDIGWKNNIPRADTEGKYEGTVIPDNYKGPLVTVIQGLSELFKETDVTNRYPNVIYMAESFIKRLAEELHEKIQKDMRTPSKIEKLITNYGSQDIIYFKPREGLINDDKTIYVARKDRF